MMKITHLCKARCNLSKPQLVRSILVPSSPSFLLSSPPKALISSKSLVNSVHRHQHYGNPVSYCQFRLISSSRSSSASPRKPVLCHCPGHSCLCADTGAHNSRRVVLNPVMNRIQRKPSSGSSGSSSVFHSQKASHFHHPQTSFRFFSASSFDKGIDELVRHVSPKRISEILEVIRRDENDMETRLSLMNLRLSVASVTEIFRVLNLERVSAMRFFIWVRRSQSELSRNFDFCSLIIDNCGWLGDYETMRCILKDFNTKRLCLTTKAFGFVPVFTLSKDSIMDFVRNLIEVLDDIGGTCRSSGVFGLIEMFSVSSFFEMAKFVMEITERKTSYYNVLIGEMCRKCNFEEAQCLIVEMQQHNCNPDAKTYNYLLSSLCKNNRGDEACNVLKKMQESGCSPDALTFEIFIYYSYRLGKLDLAVKFLDQMVFRGIEPRLATHAAFVKGYFHSGQYEEAYEYVVDSDAKYEWPSNAIYSLLALLHQRNGNHIVAQKILIEMIEKGLRPKFSVYRRVLKHLMKSGREDLAADLRSRFCGLSSRSSAETG